jgi:predicted nucleic acid-binding protein
MTGTPVFPDTVGLLASWDIADQWHGAADAAFRAILSRRRPMVTTTCILLECGNAAAR